MTPRPGLLRGSKIKNYKGSNALRVTWSPPPGFSTSFNRTDATLQATFLPPIEDEAADILTHTATFVYRLRRRAALISRPRAERIDRRRPMARAMLSTPPGMWRLPS